jgi:hypothetical protein
VTTREYAKNLFSKWSDDDWLNQPVFDKLFWEALNGSRSVNAAGIQPINFTRWRKQLRDGDTLPPVSELKAALVRMERRGYVFTDEDTGEVLIRSRIRNDGLDKQPTMFLGALRILAVIDSPKFAAVMHVELARMVCPEVTGEKDYAKQLRAALNKASVAARAHLETLAATCTDPLPEPFEGESLGESPRPTWGDSPRGSNGGSTRPAETGPTDGPTPRGSTGPPVSVSVSVSPSRPTDTHLGRGHTRNDEPAQTAPPAPSDEPPRRCPKHEDHDDPPLCGNCAEARRANDKWNLAQRKAETETLNAQAAQRRADEATARTQAIANCPLCDPDGYRLPDTLTVCDHQPDRAQTNARGIAAVRAALKRQPTDDEPPPEPPEPENEPEPLSALTDPTHDQPQPPPDPDEPPY